MSKTFSALEKIQEQRNENLHFSSAEEKNSGNLGAAKQTDPMVKMGTLIWLAVSITATVCSYSLGVQQGIQQAQTDSPKQWLYYYTDAQVAPEVQKSILSAKKNKGEVVAPSDNKTVLSGDFQSKQESAPAPAQPEVTIPKEGFTIQVVTYAGVQQAQKEVQKLIQKGHTAFVIPSGKYYQVCIESFDDKKAAQQQLVKLRTDGYHKLYPGAFVRPVVRH